MDGFLRKTTEQSLGDRGRAALALLVVCVVTLAALGAGVGVASADQTGDSLEPNDDRDSAAVVDGDAADWSGLTIDDSADEDYIAIEAEAGETITAEMAFDDDAGDLDLELQDADGIELANSVSISDDESISYTVEESGTYYVRAYGWAGATNEYDLSVTVNESSGNDGSGDDTADHEPDRLESNDSPSEATVVDGDTAGWSGLTVHDSADEDFIAIDAEAGETITAGMAFDDGAGDLDLELQDADGIELASSVSISDDESISYTVDESGTYYVRVYGWAGATNQYDIGVAANESGGDDSTPGGYQSDALEPNDDRDSATLLDGDGASWTGLTIDDGTDDDYVAVEAEAGETITAEMNFADDAGDLDLELQDADGIELASSVSISDDETVSYTVEESGTYYVRAYGWAGATNQYDLTVTVNESGGGEWDDGETGYEPDALESNDSPDEATTADSDGASWTGLTIDDGTDEDYITIDAEAGETITAEMNFADDAGDLDLELQNADGVELTDSISVTDDETIAYTVEESGTYYVRAYGWAGATNQYDLTVTVNESAGDQWRDDDGTSYGPDALEPNDSPDDATVVDGDGASWTGLTIDDTTDEDYVAVDAEAGETITAQMCFDDDEGDLDLELQTADGTELTDSISISDDESISYTVDESGTYYVRAYGWAGATNQYDLNVSVGESAANDGGSDEGSSYAADTLEPNDDRDSAAVVDGDAGEWSGLTIDDETDEDYVAVDAEAGETIIAQIAFTDDSGDLDLTLQNADGSALASSISVTDDETVSYTVEESGTYYVRVYGWAGATNQYDLSVDTREAVEGNSR